MISRAGRGTEPRANPTLFDRMRVYLDDFISAVDGERTDADALARMKRLCPGFEEEGFLLAHSVAFHGPDARSKQTA
jgi:hypothetical protein